MHSSRSPAMQAGSKNIRERDWIKLLLPILLTLVTLGNVACDQAIRYGASQYATQVAAHRATEEMKSTLTRAYGTEVSQAIDRFENTRRSLEAYKNPDIQSQVETEQMIAYAGILRTQDPNDPKWYITTSSAVKKVKVLEYDAVHFKAIACVKQDWATVNQDGTLLESYPNEMERVVYVFLREQAQWKNAAYMNIRDLDEAALAWKENAPDWEKELMGELPHDIEPNCWANPSTATPPP